MKAISLWNPWAHLVVVGAKSFETRHWPTNVRGTVAIHAAKVWTRELQSYRHEPFFNLFWPNEMPLGCLLGTVDIIGCHRVESSLIERLSDQELAFGNYEIGRYAWELRNPVAFEKPIPWKGMQGFFEVPDEIVRRAA